MTPQYSDNYDTYMLMYSLEKGSVKAREHELDMYKALGYESVGWMNLKH